VTVSWAQIASTLDRIRRGLDTYKDNLTALQSWQQKADYRGGGNYQSLESKPAAIKLFRKSTPAVRLARYVAYLMIGITTVVLVPTVAGTIAVLATSLLGLPFFHLTLVLIAGGVFLLWAAKQYYFKYVQEPREEMLLYRWHVALKMFAIEGFPLKNSAPLIWAFSALQVCQGLGIISWAWYLPSGPSWIDITDQFFGSFSIPRRFYFEINFFLEFFLRLFTFRLFEFELFGSAVAVQVLTYVGTAARYAVTTTESAVSGTLGDDRREALDALNAKPKPDPEKERKKKEEEELKKKRKEEEDKKRKEEEKRKAEEERLRAAEERRRAASRADKFTPAFASALDPGSLVGHKISVVGIGKKGASMVGTVVSFKKGIVFGMGESKHKVDFGGKIKRVLLLHDGNGGKEFSLFDDAKFAARFGAKVTMQSPMHSADTLADHGDLIPGYRHGAQASV
jgi:hypothetical protein